MENRVGPLDVGIQAGSPQTDSISSPSLNFPSPTSTETDETSPVNNSYILIQDEITLPRSNSREEPKPEHIALLSNSLVVSNGKPTQVGHQLAYTENREEQPLVHGQKKNEDGRETWTSGMDFLLSIIGYAVDLAAVWRFPYYAYKNGGGTFLIPYFIMLIIGATPLLYLELLIGQFHRQGPISVWTRISPIFQGIGFCAVMVSFYTSFYYNNILAWSFFYFFASMSSELPWSDCVNRTWASDLCDANISNSGAHYNSSTGMGPSRALRSPAQDYFDNHVLGLEETSGFDSLGWPRWQLVLCLALAYIVLFLALFKGVKSSGKVVWVTAIAPYIILLILLIRGIFLPGAVDGLRFYLNFDLKRLGHTQVWIDAAVQVFYSIGAGFGVHLALSSYNSFHHPTTRDCLITVGANAAANLLSGFVVFAYLGYMSAKQNVGIEQVAKNGPGLVFQVYPEAIGTLPAAPLWSVLFFLMLLTLGMDSSMGGMESIITGVCDYFHDFFRSVPHSRPLFTAALCIVSFLFGLINCTPGGIYTFQWFDTFSAGVSLLFVAFFEAIAVGWFYGIDQFSKDIEDMLGSPPGFFWRICWKFLSPLFLIAAIIAAAVTFPTLKYDNYTYPVWANVVGWTFSLSTTILIPIVAISKLVTTKGSLYQKVALSISPLRDYEEITGEGYVRRFHRKHWLQL